MGDTQWCSWLRHCATSRKVTGLIPNDVIGIFHWHNHSGRIMALGSIQPLREISTRNISWVRKGSWCMGLTTLPPFYANCFDIWEPQPPGTHRACFTFTFYMKYVWRNMIVVHTKSLEQFACIHTWHKHSTNCKTSNEFNTIFTYFVYV